MKNKPTSYLVPRAVITPVVLSLVAIFLAYNENVWVALSIPFIVLGSLCSAPNLNLADGFFAWVAIILGWVLSHYYPEPALPIIIGTFLGWCISSFEMKLRAVPVYDVQK